MYKSIVIEPYRIPFYPFLTLCCDIFNNYSSSPNGLCFGLMVIDSEAMRARGIKLF